MRKSDLSALASSCVTHPSINYLILKEGLSVRRLGSPTRSYIFSTHHKALTVFLGRILKAYALIAGRSFSQGCGHEIDWTARLILDHHSDVNLDEAGDSLILHVRRDPRDILISSCFYHQKSEEPWLHHPRQELDGKSYQDHLRSLPDLEEKLIFEMDHASGETIRDMTTWNYSHPSTIEMKYEDMIRATSFQQFEAVLRERSLPAPEIRLLVQLYKNFSLDGPWMSRRHVRNPKPEQWRGHFTSTISAAFEQRFPDAVRMLGYA